jgi:hypothetical protein
MTGSEPQVLGAAEWQLIAVTMTSLFLFVALAIDAALAFLLGSAVVPSLLDSHDVPVGVRRLRGVLLPIGVVALLLTFVALGRALVLAAQLLHTIFPRFGV